MFCKCDSIQRSCTCFFPLDRQERIAPTQDRDIFSVVDKQTVNGLDKYDGSDAFPAVLAVTQARRIAPLHFARSLAAVS